MSLEIFGTDLAIDFFKGTANRLSKFNLREERFMQTQIFKRNNFLTIIGFFTLFIILTFTTVSKTRAAGLLIAEGGFGGVLEIIEHDISVTINNGVAVTEITQVFRNTENRQVEALYTFPVPKGASVSNFSMWINGQEMIGEVLEKEKAREIYNSYKQESSDCLLPGT
jgi:Ca-activated chloride channel family protein